MALTTCPDCGGSVSDAATCCPTCGRTEATGKRWKTRQAASVGLMVLALAVLHFGGAPYLYASVTVAAAGVAVGLVGRVGAWWHHG